MRKNRTIPSALALAAVLGGALAATVAGAPAAITIPGHPEAAKVVTKRVVVMDNFFEPRSVSIRRGEKVVWIWKGDNSHNVTFTKVPKTATKNGADTRKEGRWTRKFRKRGFYKYICTIHSGQRGTIEVTRPEPPPPAPPE